MVNKKFLNVVNFTDTRSSKNHVKIIQAQFKHFKV